jgi:hypothetical protein
MANELVVLDGTPGALVKVVVASARRNVPQAVTGDTVYLQAFEPETCRVSNVVAWTFRTGRAVADTRRSARDLRGHGPVRPAAFRWRMTFSAVVLAVVGLVHLVPATAVSGHRLGALYGIAPDGDLALLLRHRAVLFGVLGVACLAAVLRPAWQVPVMISALASTASFVVLAYGSPALGRVWWADVVLSVLLVAALGTRLR